MGLTADRLALAAAILLAGVAAITFLAWLLVSRWVRPRLDERAAFVARVQELMAERVEAHPRPAPARRRVAWSIRDRQHDMSVPEEREYAPWVADQIL